MTNQHISDLNQPRIEGLKIMVKNGKKPLAYPQNPSCIIPVKTVIIYLFGNNTSRMDTYVWVVYALCQSNLQSLMLVNVL